MRMKLELTEDEAKEALAEWARKRYAQSVDAKDVTFSISPADSDPRSPRDAHIGQVTIVVSGLPLVLAKSA